MPKPDPALLDPARYPFQCLIETRYRDLDSNLHINNGVFATLLEEGRVRFHRESGIQAEPGKVTSMVASLAIEFLGESHFPDPLEMHIAVAHMGRTSYRLAQLVMQSKRVVCYAECVLVCSRDGKPAEIPAAFREAGEKWKPRT